jgi:hypothetical protein
MHTCCGEDVEFSDKLQPVGGLMDAAGIFESKCVRSEFHAVPKPIITAGCVALVACLPLHSRSFTAKLLTAGPKKNADDQQVQQWLGMTNCVRMQNCVCVIQFLVVSLMPTNSKATKGCMVAEGPLVLATGGLGRFDVSAFQSQWSRLHDHYSPCAAARYCY